MDSALYQLILATMNKTDGIHTIVISPNGTSYSVQPLTIGDATSDRQAITLGQAEEISLSDRAYTDSKVLELIGTSPDLLNKLDEIAQAINNDPEFNTTVVALIASKEDIISTGLNSQYFRGDKTWQTLDKTAVGLSNVPNIDPRIATNITQDGSHRFTTDAEKAAWDAKQDALVAGSDYLAPNGNGGSLTGLSKDQVGLGNVPNVDATVASNIQQASSYRFVSDTDKANWNAKQEALVAGTDYATPSALSTHTSNTSNPHSVTKTQVGLGNVDNTSDLLKPVSTATQTALNAKQNTLVVGTDYLAPSGNGGSLTNLSKTQVGLGNVDNTSDTTKNSNVIAVASLTSSANAIAISMLNNTNFKHTMTENTTVQNPTNVAEGMSGCITFTQHATVAKTIAFASNWKSTDGTVPAMSTTLGAINVASWYATSATEIWFTFMKKGVA